MKQRGVYGFVIHPRMGLSKKIGYMTPQWLRMVRFAVEGARRRQMIVYLYDEGMYPSGSAHGAVVKGRPDLASQGLLMEKFTGSAPADGAENVVATLKRGDTVYRFRRVPSGGVIRGVHFDEEANLPGAPPSADLLNPEATRRFIQFTHEKYKSMVGEEFSRTIRGIFTDEPNILGRRSREGLKPWTKGLLPKISELAGYDFKPYLPLLWEKDEKGLYEVVRTDYRHAVASVLNESYYGPLHDWCAANHLVLTGHPRGAGELIPEYYFDQPGQDIVWRTVLPGKTATEGEQSLTSKTAASMALHLGRDTVINECYGAYGWRLTMSEMKWLADWLFVRGTNLLMPHAFYYSTRGPRLMERPPDLAWSNLWWDHYKQFADYTNRMSWLLRGGKPVAGVAILAIGGEAKWRAAEVLYRSQIDFFYVEESLLDDATISGGELKIGPACYRVVVLDGARNLRPETFARLRRLIRGKVKVIALGSPLTPHPILPDRRTPAERWQMPERAGDGPALVRAIRTVLPADLESSEPAPELRYTHRIKDGVSFYLLTNEGNEPIRTRVWFHQSTVPEVWDAETGRFSMPRETAIEKGRVRAAIDLPPRNSVIFAFTEKQGSGAKEWLRPEVVSVDSGGWKLTVGGRVFEEVSLGSWTALEGMASFSGTARYDRDVTLTDPGSRIVLDLGEVRDFAEVSVNGESAGVRLWPPYRFDITGMVKPGTNHITAAVTNTRANELTDEKPPSGLMGPVRVLVTRRPR